MKYSLIESMRQTYPVAHMCQYSMYPRAVFMLGELPPCERDRENARLEIEIQAAHQRTRAATYSAKRLYHDFVDHGVQATLYRVRTLRKKMGLRCKQKRQFKITTDSKHHLPIAPIILKREFSVNAPTKAWVSDITIYQLMKAGCIYLE